MGKLKARVSHSIWAEVVFSGLVARIPRLEHEGEAIDGVGLLVGGQNVMGVGDG